MTKPISSGLPFVSLRGLFMAAFLLLLLAPVSGHAAAAEKKPPAKPTAEGGAPNKIWNIACDEDKASKKKQCFVSQDQYHTASKQLALRFSFGYIDSDKKPVILAMVPLGVHLPAAPQVKIDDKSLPLVMQHCTPAGCLGAVQLDAATEQQLRKSKSVTVVVLPMGTTTAIAFPVNMDGFEKELKLLR